MRHTAFLERLALDGSADERAIRRAYARELKRIDPEADPAAFQELREAYEAALDWARWNQAPGQEPQTDVAPDPAPERATAERPAEVPEADAPIHELITPPEPLPARPTPSQAEPGMDGLAPQEAAARAFAVFSHRLVELALASDKDADRPYQRELENALAAPLLTSIAARDVFEWHVAKKLASGWQPGHESLLVAAVRAFNWHQDRRHLARFGPVGDILNRAIDEGSAYCDQPDHTRVRQREVIARLRDPAQPSHGELIGKLPVAERLAGRFPAWFSLVTSMENLAAWRRLDDSVPDWRRRLAFRAPKRKPGRSTKFFDPDPALKWLVSFVVLLLGVGLTAVQTRGKLPDQSVMVVHEYATRLGCLNSVDLVQFLSEVRKPGNMTWPPACPSNADLRDDRAPPIDMQQIGSVLSGHVSQTACVETASLAQHYIASGVGPDAVFGPDLARRFLGDVGACIEAGMWPREPGEGGKPFGHKELADAKPQGFLGQLKAVIAQSTTDPQAADRSPRLPPATNPSAAEAARIRALLDHYQNMPRQGRPPHLDEAEQGGSLPSPKPPSPGSGG
jgi:hypothetical protein